MKYYTKQEVIQYLRNCIKYKYTQKQLAKELGVSQAHLSEVLCGKKDLGTVIPKGLKAEILYKF